jgi:hypothetical protein
MFDRANNAKELPMKRFFLIIFLLSLLATPALSQKTSWESVEKILGRKGTVQGDMFKAAYPRTDLDVKIGDVSVDPRVGLTSWIAFRSNQKTVVMGDLVLKADEVGPVVKKLAAEKIDITGLHNHLMNTSTPVMYLHFSGSGDADALAASLKSVLAQTGTPLAAETRPPETVPEEFSVVQYFLGQGKQAGSVLQYEYPRNQTITENDMEIPGFLGTATSLNFQAADGKVAATGDFVLTANEVNPVIKTLTDNNISVTAVHNHMLRENPRLFYLHFWAYDSPQAVANGLRSALDNVNVRKQNL